MKNWFKNIFANSKTTTAGIASLVAVGFAIYHDPKLLTDPVMGPALIAGATNGIGNILGQDMKTTPGAVTLPPLAQPPQPPASTLRP